MGENAPVVKTGVSINGLWMRLPNRLTQRGKSEGFESTHFARLSGSVSMTCQFLETPHLRWGLTYSFPQAALLQSCLVVNCSNSHGLIYMFWRNNPFPD